jgi:hypothetical protein
MTHTSCGQLWTASKEEGVGPSTLVELHLVRRPTNFFPKPFGPSSSIETIVNGSDRRVSAICQYRGDGCHSNNKCRIIDGFASIA